MKKIWISSLAHDEEKVQKTMAMLKTYAMEVNGHFWEDDLKKMAWLGPREELIKKDTSLWLVLSTDRELSARSVRYGLSLLALSVQASRSVTYRGPSTRRKLSCSRSVTTMGSRYARPTICHTYMLFRSD